MRSSSAPAVALLLLALTSSAEVIERVLAVVDDTPVLLSETLLVQRLKQTDREPALQALIDETLMLREASRLREAAASAEEEQRAYESLLARLEPGAASADKDALRRIARRQTVILKYIELRFRPQLRVDDAELLSAYQEEYGGRPDAPPFDAISKQLHARLTSRALDRRIEAWVAELRSGARIRSNPEPPQP
jgi:hypothetical protein